MTDVPLTSPRDHVVQFYQAEQDLVAQAGNYVLAALQERGAAIVIAERGHHRAFDATLSSAGVDTARARDRGDYLTVDAQEQLTGIMSGRRPDPGSFEQAIGSMIERAASRGGPVRVYGELVALLWKSGQVPAAIELEEMWTGLIHRYPFGLWCGYPASAAAGGAHDAVGEVCRLHSAIVGQVPGGHPSGAGSAVLTREFPATLHAPGQARRFVTAALQASGAAARADDAALIVTELATNAVCHARSGFTVTLTTRPTIRISVRDAGDLPASVGGHPLPVRQLHGLATVAALTSSWGADRVSGGKDVWAELPG